MAVNDCAIISADILSIFADMVSIPIAFETLSRLKLVATLIWAK